MKCRWEFGICSGLYIARVTIIHSTDKYVKSINSAFNVKDSSVNLTDVNIFGVEIDKAILLESHRVDKAKNVLH